MTTPDIQIKLREIPFFAEINETKLSTLASFFEFRQCGAGEVICRQGDEANGFSVIVTGQVRVSVSGPGGGQVTLNTLKEGDWFGEIALVQNTLRTATLTSVTPCLLLYLSSSRFHSFLSLAPELRQRLFDSIISRRTANSLKAIPLFSFLSRMENGSRVFDEQKLQLLGEMFTFEDYRSNHTVFEEGDKADAFYIIQKGTVGVYARRGANDEELMAKSRRDEANKRRLRVVGTDDEDDEDDTGDSSSTHDEDSGSDCSSCGDGSPSQRPLPPPLLTSPSASGAPPSPRAAGSPQTTHSAGILLNELTKNDWFGEIALVSNTPRTATVITKTPCILFKLLSVNFSRFLSIVPQVKDKFSKVQSQRIATTLSNIPFFRHVRENKPAAKLTVLGGMFTFEHYEAGQVVCREGEHSDKFTIIVDGTVEVSKTIQTPEGTSSVLLETLTKNNWFGEMQLIKEKPMLSTFTCRDDCLVLSVTRDKFTRFIKVAPEIVDHFSKLVTYRTASMLHECDLFDIHEDRAWSKLELFCSMFDYEFVWKDQDVMREGEMNDECNKFYIIQQGSVRVTTAGSAVVQEAKEIEQKQETTDETVGKQIAAVALSDTNSSSSTTSSASSSAAGTPRAGHTPLTINIFTPTHHRTPSSVVKDKGAYFGELSLLYRVPRPHTIHTLTPCVFLTMPPRKFHQFCKLAPEIRRGLEKRLADMWPHHVVEGSGEEERMSPFDPNEEDEGGTTGSGGGSGGNGSGSGGSGGAEGGRAGGGGGSGDGVGPYNLFVQRILEEQQLRRPPSSGSGAGTLGSRRVVAVAGGDEHKH